MVRPVVDIVGYASIDRIEAPDGQTYDSIGGAAIYAALSAARLAVTPRLCIAIGQDFPEDWLAQLTALGIDTTRVERRAGPSRRTRLVYGQGEARKNSAYRADLWWERTRALAPPLPGDAQTCLVCPIPPERIAEMRNAAPGQLIADTSEVFAQGGAQALARFQGVDTFAPSLDEAEMLTGEVEEDLILARLSGISPLVILKRGVCGLLVRQDGQTLVCAPTPRVAVDPTGAGDATIGAISAAAALGLDLAQQLAAGAEAGALTVQKPGPIALGWEANLARLTY